MKEDKRGALTPAPLAHGISPRTVFAPCQRRKHHLLPSSSIRGFLTSGLPKLAVDAGPSYSQHTPANVRVQKLRAISADSGSSHTSPGAPRLASG